ncbi:MAG: hypothetical protein U0835_06750 [Isosphaeraceae bacterium]
MVKGSHGLPAADEQDRPVLIGDGPEPGGRLHSTDVHSLMLRALAVEN